MFGIDQAVYLNAMNELKNVCPGGCYQRGCGMLHGYCMRKMNESVNQIIMANKTVDNLRAVKYEFEKEVENILLRLEKESGLKPTYIEIRDGKVIITLSLE